MAWTRACHQDDQAVVEIARAVVSRRIAPTRVPAILSSRGDCDELGTRGSSHSCRSGQYVAMAGGGHEGFFERCICSRGDRDHDHRARSRRGYPARTGAFLSHHDHRGIHSADGRCRRARCGGARTDRVDGAPACAAALMPQSGVRLAFQVSFPCEAAAIQGNSAQASLTDFVSEPDL